MTCRLSPSQARVTRLTAQGYSIRQIAQALGLRPQTVKNYLCTAMNRLGARNRIDLVSKVRRLEITSGPVPLGPSSADD